MLGVQERRLPDGEVTLEGVEEVEGAGASDGEADNIYINVEGARLLAGAVVVVTDISGED